MAEPMHVLIVEDTFIALTVIKLQMSQQGCIVDTASDGASALEKTLQTRYDLILMDIGLGEGPNGFEITAQIRKQSELNKATPIMAVTAHGEPEYNKKAIECGMNGYFNKPFTFEDAKKLTDYIRNKAL